MLPLSLYIHIPWCLSKCPYCDFNSHALKKDISENRYVELLLADLARDMVRYRINGPLQSIFIGGGTPSLFSPESIERLLCGIKSHISFVSDIEITLEANPGTFEFRKFAEFRGTGVNRLSLGVQSFDDTLLLELGQRRWRIRQDLKISI